MKNKRYKSIFIQLIIVFGGFVWYIQSAQGQKDYYKPYEDGLKYVERKEYEKAIECFKKATYLEFKDKLEALYLGDVVYFSGYFPHREMGICYYNLRDYQIAEKELRLSMGFQPSDRAKEYLSKLEKLKGTEPSKDLEAYKQETQNLLLYDPSKIVQVGSRLSAAVLPFENKGKTKDLEEIALEKMITVLYELKRFVLIERAQLEKVIKEQALGQTGALDITTATKVGKIFGVDVVVIGTIVQTEMSIGIEARLIDVESSTVLVAKDAYMKGAEPYENLKTLINNVAIQLCNDVPLVEGQVILVQPDGYYLDIGTEKGIRNGMKCIVYRKGEAIKHPVSGEIIGSKIEELGELVLDRVEEKMSLGTLTKKTEKTILVGDKVVTR
ncbi:MAG: CsgG/HfaB family protein [Candidatus Edwardsbacteria bacterium]